MAWFESSIAFAYSPFLASFLAWRSIFLVSRHSKPAFLAAFLAAAAASYAALNAASSLAQA